MVDIFIRTHICLMINIIMFIIIYWKRFSWFFFQMTIATIFQTWGLSKWVRRTLDNKLVNKKLTHTILSFIQYIYIYIFCFIPSRSMSESSMFRLKIWHFVNLFSLTNENTKNNNYYFQHLKIKSNLMCVLVYDTKPSSY